MTSPARRPPRRRRFRFTPQARQDLKEIFGEIAEDNPDVADRLRDELFEGLDRVARNPGIGHYHEELLDRRYRFWSFYSWVIAYEWEVRPIAIVAIVHGARDLGVFFDLRAQD